MMGGGVMADSLGLLSRVLGVITDTAYIKE